jgi:hypothetical protein
MEFDSSLNLTRIFNIERYQININNKVFNGIYSFSTDFNINKNVNSLIKNLNQKKYPELIETYLSIINNKGLFSEYVNKDKIFDIYSKYVKIRNFIRRKINLKKLNKCRIINDTDLALNNFNVIDQDKLDLFDINNKSIYQFRFCELVRIFKYSLLYRSIDYSTPKPIKNPYTNNLFNLKQLIEICNFIQKQYNFYGKKIPSYLYQFISSYYDVDIFNKNFAINNLYKVHNEYIETLDDDEWWDEFNDFIKVYPEIKKSYCKICVLDKHPNTFRLLITPILTINFMNDSDIYYMGHAKDKYIYLSKKLGLYFNEGHSIIHCKNKRKRNTNISTILPLQINTQINIELPVFIPSIVSENVNDNDNDNDNETDSEVESDTSVISNNIESESE